MAMAITDQAPYLESYQDFNSPGGGGSITTIPQTIIGSNTPTVNYDISVLTGLKDSDKYLGRNRVSDIRESYQTYLTGQPFGRGGQYAVDAARKYGTTITEAARGYLQAAGIPTLANLIPGGNTPPTIPDTPTLPGTPDNPTTPTTPTTPVENPFKLLVDEFKSLFGTPVYNPPLQQQSSGYIPQTSFGGSSTGSSSGGFSILIIVAIIGAIGYFLYKHYAN